MKCCQKPEPVRVPGLVQGGARMPGGFIQVAKHSSSSSSSSSSPSSFSSLSSSSLSSSSSPSSYIHLHHLSYRFQSLSFVVNPLTPRQETICLLQVSLTLNFQILNPIHLQIFNNTLNVVLTSLLNSFLPNISSLNI